MSESGNGAGGAEESRGAPGDATTVAVARAARPTNLRGLLRLLWDHAGRIAAIFLGVVALLALLFLAIIGSSEALVLLVVLVVGVAMIAIGGRVRA